MFSGSVETSPAAETQVNTEPHDILDRLVDASVVPPSVITPADSQFNTSLRNLLLLHICEGCCCLSSKEEDLGSSPASSEDSHRSRRSSRSSRSSRRSRSCAPLCRRSPERCFDHSQRSSCSRYSLWGATRSPLAVQVGASCSVLGFRSMGSSVCLRLPSLPRARSLPQWHLSPLLHHPHSLL